MAIQGKGFFIWRIPNCEKGSAEDIAKASQAAGLTHVAIKIGDGITYTNLDREKGQDLIPPVAQALRNLGIQVWGWHYVYGSDPLGEARKAIQRISTLNLDGYVIDAELEYEEPGREAAAKKFTHELRKNLPDLPMALSSYRYPSYHRTFPWRVFLEAVDYNMPQVYWEQAHNPASQLDRVIKEYQKLAPFRPIIPTGPTYKVNGWRPTPEDTQTYLETAAGLHLDGVNFFSWDECKRDLPALWDVIAAYQWPGATPQKDLPEQFIDLLNAGDVAGLAGLYDPGGVHITADETLLGPDAIRSWYETFLGKLLPKGRFILTGKNGSANTLVLTWQAVSSKGVVKNGSDTIGLLKGKIGYHYTYFTISTA
jgi:hypothetical protein